MVRALVPQDARLELTTAGADDADRGVLRQLALLNLGVIACAVIVAVLMIIAAMQAVAAIDAAAASREQAQVSRALEGVPTLFDDTALALVARALDLSDARIVTPDRVAPGEISVPTYRDAGRVVAWTPHRFGSMTFDTVAPLRVVAALLFVLATCFAARRIHRISQGIERRRVAATLLAMTDGLTGVHNRLAFDTNLKSRSDRASAGGPGFALIFIDLDGFKAINDQLGHAAGDAVLKALAGHLRACAMPGDHVARVGGDEFAVLRSPEKLDEFLDDLRWRVAIPVPVAGRELRIAASIGVARSADFPGDPAQLTSAADAALYRAKRGGTGNTEFAIPSRPPRQSAA